MGAPPAYDCGAGAGGPDRRTYDAGPGVTDAYATEKRRALEVWEQLLLSVVGQVPHSGSIISIERDRLSSLER